MAEDVAVAEDEGAIGLYFQLQPEQLIDLEVAASAAIEWARGARAAAAALDPGYEYRVTLIAAEPGSSKWRARIDRAKATIEASAANQTAERVKAGWEKVPLLLRWTIALAVVVPVTAKPTWEYWTDSENFSHVQQRQLEDAIRKVMNEPAVKAHRQSMYGHVQRDPNISGVGAGIPRDADWKPKQVVPANQFAEGGGLFEPQAEVAEERIVYDELNVILVSPQLENARRVWTFRQEGIPGVIRAEMKDKRFLAALEKNAVRETLRANIPMRIRLEIKLRRVDGEWKVTRRGRSVVEVISPVVSG